MGVDYSANFGYGIEIPGADYKFLENFDIDSDDFEDAMNEFFPTSQIEFIIWGSGCYGGEDYYALIAKDPINCLEPFINEINNLGFKIEKKDIKSVGGVVVY